MASDSYMVQYDANNKKKDDPHLHQQQTRLTPEEIRVLKECNRESFYYRCLPLASISVAATYFGVKQGILKGHPRFGASLKMLGAGVVGWFVGKISYRSICEEKFVHLPNSNIGELIRKKKGYAPSEFQQEKTIKFDEGTTRGKDDSSFLPDPNYNPSYGAFNLDTDKNIQSAGLDDRERPTTDSFQDLTIEDLPQRAPVSYEELRKQNREDYERQFRSQQQQLPPSSSPSSWDSFPRRRDFNSEGPSRSTYGDWEK